MRDDATAIRMSGATTKVVGRSLDRTDILNFMNVNINFHRDAQGAVFKVLE